MDTVTHALLQDIARREGRSLLQYVSEAFPWTTPEEKDAVARIRKMVEEEQEGAASLTRLLIKKRVKPPYLGSYPMNFTSLNYLSLAHLLPVLLDYENQRIADLETYVTRVADLDAVVLVRRILEYKRRHLQTLREMARPPGVAA